MLILTTVHDETLLSSFSLSFRCSRTRKGCIARWRSKHSMSLVRTSQQQQQPCPRPALP